MTLPHGLLVADAASRHYLGGAVDATWRPSRRPTARPPSPGGRDGPLRSPVRRRTGLVRRTAELLEQVGAPWGLSSDRPSPGRDSGMSGTAWILAGNRAWRPGRNGAVALFGDGRSAARTVLAPRCRALSRRCIARTHYTRAAPAATCPVRHSPRESEPKFDHRVEVRMKCADVENQPAARLSYAGSFPLDGRSRNGGKLSSQVETWKYLDRIPVWASVCPRAGAVVAAAVRSSPVGPRSVVRESSDTEISGWGDPRKPGFCFHLIPWIPSLLTRPGSRVNNGS